MSWQTNRSTKKTCASRIELSQKMPQRRNYFSVIIIWKAGRLCWAWWSIPTIQQLQSGESRVSSKVRFHLKRLKKKWGEGKGWFWEEGLVGKVPVSQAWDPEFRSPGTDRQTPGTRWQPGVLIPAWRTSSEMGCPVWWQSPYLLSHLASPYKLLKTR